MKVVALSIMNSSTSGNAPRGINTFDANVFSYWQYIDQLVYWGGSSGEGIIVPPSPDVVDAAHKNGVPVLGTIFFPQTEHGGKIEWLDTFLSKDSSGKFPIVDKLIEVANQYHFDGWFINQETDTEVTSFDDVAAGNEKENALNSDNGLTKEHAVLMKELIAEFKKKANQKLEIMWYDSMTSEGEMDWQNALTDKNEEYLVDAQLNPLADSMFLNFWWTTDKLAEKELLKASNSKAAELTINPYQLYAGVDVQEAGYMTPVKWSLFTDNEGIPYTSLGLYGANWPYTSASNTDDFQMRENIFWVNGQGDPRRAEINSETQWPGISTYAVEQTAITQLPFITNFSLGNGYNYFIEGEKVSSQNWNNRSMQDILPTYHWVLDHDPGNNLEVSIDYAEAYNGGNSLKLRGFMKKGEKSIQKMYSSAFTMTNDDTFTITAKATTSTELALILTYEDGETEFFKGNKKITDEWTTVSYDIKNAVGKVVTEISYQIIAEDNSDIYELHMGQLAIKPKQTETKLSVSEVKVEDTLFDEEEGDFAGVRLSWMQESAEEVGYYEIYRVNADDSRSFLSVTPATHHYLNALERSDETNETIFEVTPVDKFGHRGKASQPVKMEWPDNRIPKADFTASRTLAAPGETITFQNTSSSNTKTIKWEFEGAEPKMSTEDAPSVTYPKAGVYSVKLIAENEAGEAPIEYEHIITIDDKATGNLTLLSQNVLTEASSFVNDGEAPEFAVDGKNDTKWCATGNTPHFITLDLGEVKTVSEVRMAHAEAGGESPDMNTKAYTIEVSEDGKEFTQVSRTIRNEVANSLNTFAAVPARYVKISIDKPTQGSDSAARIYGVEVYGLNERL